MRLITPLVILAAAALASIALLAGTGGDALLGFDAYPLIAASRFESAGDVFGTFGEELMDGRYPDGRFYRPLVHLSFGLDHALGGLSPATYFVTDLAICAIAAALVGLVAARLAGTSQRARIGAGVCAALVVACHRAQLDVVPYAARRADALCILFVAATALASLRGARPWTVGALALCAFLSKESGVIAVPVAFAAALARDGETPRSAALDTIGPAIGIALGLAVRTAVLGGLGGHAESGAVDSTSVAAIAPRLWGALTADVVGGPWIVVGLLIGTALPIARGGRSRALILALVWSASALAITFVSGRYHDWYALSIVPGIALVAGVALGWALERAEGPSRLAGLAGAAFAIVFATASLGTNQREALTAARRISADQVERFQDLVTPLDAGIEARFEPWVFAVAYAQGAPPVFVHAPYSLDALGDLTLSGTPVVVAEVNSPFIPPPNAVTVRLVPGPPPAQALEPRR